jgi:hypothetical protein
MKAQHNILVLFAKIISPQEWILVAAICFAATNIMSAQSYYNSPSDSLVKSTVLDHTVAMIITQQHPTGDTIYFKWKQLSVTMPAGWDASLCDNGHCFSVLMDSGMMIPIVPGDNGLMLLHCTPHVNIGTGIIRYILYATNTPSHVDTLTWIVNATATGIEATTNTQSSVWYYQNKILLRNGGENFETIRLLEICGRVIFEASILGQTEIVLPQLPTSSYIIELSGKGGIYYKRIINQ